MPDTKTIHEFDVVTTMANSDKLPLWKAASAATKAITYANFITAATASLVLSDYLKKNGTVALTGDWDIGSGRKISGDKLAARSASGLRLEDDGGNLGVFVEDGGQVGVNQAAPLATLHIGGGTTAPSVSCDLYITNSSLTTMCFRETTNNVEILVRASTLGIIGTSTAHDLSLRTTQTNRLTIDTTGNIVINSTTAALSATPGIDLNGSTLRLRTARTPASAAATGNAGEICWDTGFLYVATATNTWKRVAIATW